MAERWHWYVSINVTRCQGWFMVSANDKVLTNSASCPIITVIFLRAEPVYVTDIGHKMAERWHYYPWTNVVTRWQSNGKVLSHSPSCRFSNVALHRHLEAQIITSRMSAFGVGGELMCVVCCGGLRKDGD